MALEFSDKVHPGKLYLYIVMTRGILPSLKKPEVDLLRKIRFMLKSKN